MLDCYLLTYIYVCTLLLCILARSEPLVNVISYLLQPKLPAIMMYSLKLPGMAQVQSLLRIPAAFSAVQSLWRTCRGPKELAKGLQEIQNQCLHTVLGVFRAIPTRRLQNEAFVPSIDLRLDAEKRLILKRLRVQKPGIQSRKRQERFALL